MSTSISKIKNDLLDVICGEMPGVNVSFDYAAATEADSAVIISNMSIQYNNDLELHFQRKLNFSLLMVAKTVCCWIALLATPLLCTMWA